MILGLACFLVTGYLFLFVAVLTDRISSGDRDGMWKEAFLAPEIVWNELAEAFAGYVAEIRQMQELIGQGVPLDQILREQMDKVFLNARM